MSGGAGQGRGGGGGASLLDGRGVCAGRDGMSYQKEFGSRNPYADQMEREDVSTTWTSGGGELRWLPWVIHYLQW